ncbi:MAG: DUF58 domain-containing protein [Acidimicrobiia bacterium]|nr:DUF58 domain-containing protein [Acidimicrobiia bacterium]
MKLRPKRAVWLLLALALAMYGASRTTGAGWLVILVAVVVALIAVGVALPVVGVRRASLAVAAPRDATTGRPCTLTIESERGAIVADIPLFDSRTGLVGPVCGTVSGVPPYRGVFERLQVTIVCSAPFGLLEATRDLVVQLANPLSVAPQALVLGHRDGLDDALDQDGNIVRGRADEGTVAALTEYHPGDPLRRVHWAATAKHGDLLVKQLEPPVSQRLVVVAELSGGPYEQDDIAGRALGLVVRGLRAGIAVDLWTRSLQGIDRSTVDSPIHAGRLLAAAVVGRVARPSDVGDMTVVVVEA